MRKRRTNVNEKWTDYHTNVLMNLPKDVIIDWKVFKQEYPDFNDFSPQILKQRFFNLKKKQGTKAIEFRECQECKKKFTELSILECTCDNRPTIMGEWFVYIVQKTKYKNKSLLDPVEYVNITNNSKNIEFKKDIRVYISINKNISIRTWIDMLSPRTIVPLVNVELKTSRINLELYRKSLANEFSMYSRPKITLFNLAGELMVNNNKISRALSRPFQWGIINTSKAARPFTMQKKELMYDLSIPVKHDLEYYKSVVTRNVALSESTKQTYQDKVTCLYKQKVFEYLNDSSLVTKYLMEIYNKSTAKTYLVVLNVFLFNLADSENKSLGFNTELKYDYSTSLYNVKNELFDITESQEKNIKEQDSWVPWETIQGITDKMTDVYSQEYLGILLLVHQQALRNDYCTLGFDDSHMNYVKDDVFVWREYKTSKFYGIQDFRVKDSVKETLDYFIELRKREGVPYLFVNSFGEEMSKNEFGVMIRNTFKKYLGIPIGVQLLRKIKTSSFRQNEVLHKDSEEFAREMLHSSKVSSLFYRKN